MPQPAVGFGCAAGSVRSEPGRLTLPRFARNQLRSALYCGRRLPRPVGLGELPPFAGGYGASAYDINDRGVATGRADAAYSTKRKLNTGCGVQANSGCAVVWRAGRPTAVGPNASIGYGINNNEAVVGTFVAGPSYTSHAFLSRNGVFSDLDRLVPTGTPVLREARAINDSGWIVANGDGGRAFVLIPR
jgi:probable HAF family extracellular repeat protein